MAYVKADIDDGTHRKLRIRAAEEDKSLQEVVREAIERGINPGQEHSA